jgi:hypothetical protein
VGDAISFSSNSINRIGCNGANITTVTLNAPAHPPQPTFSIGYVTQSSKCQPVTVTLQNIANTGNRQYSIAYSIKSITPEDPQSRAALMSVLSQNTSTLLIPPNTLTDSTKYTLSVSVVNFLSQSTTKEFTLTTLSSLDPQITIIQGGPYKSYQQIVISALLTLSSCGQKTSTANNINIIWTVNGAKQPLLTLPSSTE